MIGQFATSKAGHDKGCLYVVVGQEDDFVYLSDGRLKGPDQPKKKRRKHVQPIRKLPASVRECLTDPVNDITIKRALKIYQKFRNQKQEDL